MVLFDLNKWILVFLQMFFDNLTLSIESKKLLI